MDPTVRSLAVMELTDQTVLAKIAEADMDAEVRNSAAQKLRPFAVAYNLLVGALRSEDAGVRYDAVQAILGRRDLMELVIAAIKDPDYRVRLGAIDAFNHSTMQPFPTDAIVAATKDPNSRVRETAVDVLGSLRGGQGLEALTAAMKDPDPNVRYWAATRLASNPSNGVLLAALRDHDLEVIANVYAFFISRGEPGSEDILIEALDKSGDLNMAQAFLNCGNAKLEQFARSWAAQHRV